jgi:hypothetical protein
MLAGLQGAGKTTSAGKLARWLIEKQNKKVLMVSTDDVSTGGDFAAADVGCAGGRRFCCGAGERGSCCDCKTCADRGDFAGV